MHEAGVRGQPAHDAREIAALIRAGQHEMREVSGAMRLPQARERIGEEIEPFDRMNAAKKDNDEGGVWNREPRPKTRLGARSRSDVHAVGHGDHRNPEPERSQHRGFHVGRRVQKRGSCNRRALEQLKRHALAPSAMPHRAGLQHAARRQDVRNAFRTRRSARDPFRHVPHAVDVAEIGAAKG